MRWREASWAGLSRTVARQVLTPPPQVLAPDIRTLSPGPASSQPLLCLPGESQIRGDPSLRDRSVPSGQMVPGPDPKTGARGPGSLHRDPRLDSRHDRLAPLQGQWGQESCHDRKRTYATKACDGLGPGSPHIDERLTPKGDPSPASPCQQGTLRVPETWYLHVGPAVSRRAWESWPPPMGTGGPETQGISLTLCGGTPCPQSPGRLGWDPPPTTRKETLVTIGWLSGGTLPGPRGIGGNCGVTVRRGQRSLLMRGQPRGSACVQPGLGGGTSRVVRVWGPVSGRSCPVRLGQPGPLHSHLDLQLVGARGAGRSPPHMCPHLGLGLTLTLSHLPEPRDHAKPVLQGIRPLPQPRDHPKPVLLGISPSPNLGTTQTCAPGHQTPPPNHRITQSLCSSVLDSSSQPHNHPNLR